MAKQTINLGTAPSGSGGDTPRSAFLKAQSNFDEIYSNFYQRTNVVGAVSQASGIPTGAIIESGSNSSGTYTKFADGTMICVMKNAGPFTVAANTFTAIGPFTLPIGFVSADYYCDAVALPVLSNDHFGVISAYSASNISATIIFRNGAVAQNVVSIKILCVGRWF